MYNDPELQHLCEKESTQTGTLRTFKFVVVYMHMYHVGSGLGVSCNPRRCVAGGGKSDKNEANEKNGIRSVRVSPDGKHLASGDRTGNIRVHDLTLADEVQCIEAHDTEVLCLEFTDPYATGVNFMASSSRDRLLHVFDRDQDYGLVQTLDDHSAAVTSVNFAKQDGQLLMMSCGVDKSILFRNAVMVACMYFANTPCSNGCDLLLIQSVRHVDMLMRYFIAGATVSICTEPAFDG